MDRRWLIGSVAVVFLLAGSAVYRLEFPGHDRTTAAWQEPEPIRADDSPPVSAGPSAESSSPTPSAPASARPSPSRVSPPSASSPAKPRTVPAAGRIRPGVTYRGKATFYDAGDGNGACLFGPADDMMIGAMNQTDYQSAQACGAYVQVRAGAATVTVRITNLCPLPCAPGQIDLSPQAFAKLAEPSRGEVPITWKLLSPPLSTKMSVRYKTGSSQWWCAVQVIGHRNPVARLEVRAGESWRRLPRAEYNYFVSADGAGCGGAIRVTDIYGQRLTLNGVALSPDVAQPTSAQFAQH